MSAPLPELGSRYLGGGGVLHPAAEDELAPAAEPGLDEQQTDADVLVEPAAGGAPGRHRQKLGEVRWRRLAGLYLLPQLGQGWRRSETGHQRRDSLSDCSLPLQLKDMISLRDGHQMRHMAIIRKRYKNKKSVSAA